MNRVTRIIFADSDGLSRAPMAAALFYMIYDKKDVEVFSRGINVAFEEPLNQKADAVMIGNGIETTGMKSRALKNYEITDRTIIFTMEARERADILSGFESARGENVRVLSDYVGDQLEIMDPYGGTVQSYGLCFELIKTTIKKLVAMLEDDGIFVREDD